MPSAATWMNLETIILSEVSQKEKDKQHDIAYMKDLNYYISMKQTQAHSYREQRGKMEKGRTGSLGFADANDHIQMDKQQGPTV